MGTNAATELLRVEEILREGPFWSEIVSGTVSRSGFDETAPDLNRTRKPYSKRRKNTISTLSQRQTEDIPISPKQQLC